MVKGQTTINSFYFEVRFYTAQRGLGTTIILQCLHNFYIKLKREHQQTTNKQQSFTFTHHACLYVAKFKLKLKLKEEYDMMRKLHIFNYTHMPNHTSKP